MPSVRERKTGLDQYSPFPSSNPTEKIEAAREKGRQIIEKQDAVDALVEMKNTDDDAADAADALVKIKNTPLTPEEIAEFELAVDTAVDQEFAKFTTGGSRKKMRGGEVSEVIAKSSELWKAILKTAGTPENAAIAIVATTVGVASPALVHTAFSFARTALGVAARAVTPETVAFTSCAALIYYYFGDMIIPKGKTITEDVAIGRMNNAIAEAIRTRRGSATLRTVIDNFKEDLDKSKNLTNWVEIEDDALIEARKNIDKYTARSNIGVDQLRRIDVGKSVGNYATPPSTSAKTPPPPPPTFSAESKPITTSSRWGKGGSRHRRLSAPTRKVKRSSSSKPKRYTRRRRV